ncbi:lactosylceramide 1,3-N-acetyl-beta-D-glucosaminyltransferase isoform X3 [Choloepus didactylus]|uniref:lactosylceramide 1,3-N-acetyl-beta-D-glucosaminyltransferase isoform X3 n=1 Tax=Choloepus didactylus TaxID=27675 RepID=UPI00189FAA10|nr:lactosylceramide 1,3-N-acetyl-beta-D-glucosaminyltransferase isoform X3 [Choloepus didactylus]
MVCSLCRGLERRSTSPGWAVRGSGSGVLHSVPASAPPLPGPAARRPARRLLAQGSSRSLLYPLWTRRKSAGGEGKTHSLTPGSSTTSGWNARLGPGGAAGAHTPAPDTLPWPGSRAVQRREAVVEENGGSGGMDLIRGDPWLSMLNPNSSQGTSSRSERWLHPPGLLFAPTFGFI